MENKYFQNNVVYQVYPRSFCDSNGDGIGDIQGIISKLDYLKELGIGIIWLSPVYKSPQFDIGYDISDYKDIAPEYGTLKDMDELIEEAKKREIRIVMDLVINHTSDEHPWFQEALKDINSPYRDFYYFRKGKNNGKDYPNNWDSMFSGPAWSKVPNEEGNYFLHLYSDKQIDLNFHNEKVIEEVESILKFWLDKGIYGFRCDVINQIYKTSLDDGKKRVYLTGSEHYMNQKGNHEILKRLHDNVLSKYDTMTVGETFNVDYKNAKQFMNNELDMVFQFDHVNVDKHKIPIFPKKYKAKNLIKILVGWQENNDWNANYLENHDQSRSVSRFGDTKDYYLESAKMLGTLVLTLRGTPYIFEGQEIGMKNSHFTSIEQSRDCSAHNVYHTLRKMHFPPKLAFKYTNLLNRDHARTPMQWNAKRNAGFTSGLNTWIPVNYDYLTINVDFEKKDSNSIYNYYKKLINVRKENDALNYGSFHYIKNTNKNVFAFERKYENKVVLVVLNMSKNKHHIRKINTKGNILISNYTKPYVEGILRPYECLVIQK